MTWFAVYVNVRHEKKVAEKMTESGLEAYVPVITQIRKWSDRKKKVEVPLFTGYVFVKIAPSEREKPLKFSGVVNYVKFEGKPAVIRDIEIENLKWFIKKGFHIEQVEGADMQIGDKVKINISSFKNISGEVEEISKNGTLLVNFDSLNRYFRMRLPVEAVQSIN